MINPKYMVVPTSQRQWSEGRGWFLVAAFFLGGVGGGMYLVSLYLGFAWGMLLGWLIVLLGKTTAHLLFLGRPSRFWRAFTRPNSSWISRGIIILILFTIFAALQMAPMIKEFSWLPWTSQNPVLQVLTIITALGLVSYTGFVLGEIRAIPFWNSSIVPVLFVLYALLGGTGLTLATHPLFPPDAVDIHKAERIALWLLAITAVAMIFYLDIMYRRGPGARQSMLELIKGKISPIFIFGVVVVGILVPLSVATYGIVVGVSSLVLMIGAICELIGGFSLRYSLLKAGKYEPLI